MYNTYYTIIGKTVTCPKWNVKVTLDGKYRLSDEKGKEYEGHFMFASCPIDENSRIPLHKQRMEYKMMYCPNSDSCNYLREFAKCVDVRTGQSI